MYSDQPNSWSQSIQASVNANIAFFKITYVIYKGEKVLQCLIRSKGKKVPNVSSRYLQPQACGFQISV